MPSADLNYADLQKGIALNTDFREAKNLAQRQLEGENPPFLCNSPLPKSIEIDKDRDCDQIAAALLENPRISFRNLEAAQKYVDEARQKVWDD